MASTRHGRMYGAMHHTSAVSKKLIPASSAACTVAVAVSWLHRRAHVSGQLITRGARALRVRSARNGTTGLTPWATPSCWKTVACRGRCVRRAATCPGARSSPCRGGSLARAVVARTYCVPVSHAVLTPRSADAAPSIGRWRAESRPRAAGARVPRCLNFGSAFIRDSFDSCGDTRHFAFPFSAVELHQERRSHRSGFQVASLARSALCSLARRCGSEHKR